MILRNLYEEHLGILWALFRKLLACPVSWQMLAFRSSSLSVTVADGNLSPYKVNPTPDLNNHIIPVSKAPTQIDIIAIVGGQ